MNKYFKNFVLCGDADYHCLLCRESFRSLSDLEKHIRWEKHRKVLKEQIYFAKFKKDFIYKVGNNFYCEACNCLIPSLPEVTSHNNRDTHKANIKTPIPEKAIENTVCRYNCGYVIVSDIIVQEQQWHCIINRRCLLCLKDVGNAEEHEGLNTHVINVIKARIACQSEDNFYRKIDDQLFYCFICKKTISYGSFDTHWADREHCKNKNTAVGRVTASNPNTEQEKKKALARKLIDTQRPYFEINEAKEEAVCKECKQVLKLDFKTLLDHQKSHGDNKKNEIKVEQMHESDEEEPEKVVYREVQDHGKKRSELSKYGKDNYIKLNAGGSRGYCNLCDTSLSASIKVFKQHVKGARHRGHLELKGLKREKGHKVPKTRFVPIWNLLDNLNYSESMRVIQVNKDFCVDVPGFVLTKPIITDRNSLKTKCFVCDVVFPTDIEAEAAHYRTEEHKRRFLAAKALDMANELVREIRPDVFHCAICGKVFPFWELMEKHISTSRHLRRKDNADLVQRLMDQVYSGMVFIKTSKNSDVFYLQLLDLGIFH